MTSGANPSDRSLLQFEEAVRVHLEPLLLRNGFTRTETTPYLIRFASPLVRIDVRHDRLSFEIETTASRSVGESFSLQDIVEAAEGTESPFFQASSRDRVFECVALIADLLARYGEGVLQGRQSTFEEMTRVKARRAETLTREVESVTVRHAADAAWRSKDYAAVKRLYESIRADLTEREASRLEFASKREC